MSNYNIRAISDTEFSINANGWNFLVCLGSYINGNYIALPEWGVCTKASSWDNIYYNTNQLYICKSKIVSDAAEQIAESARVFMKGDY